jgi:hypothetical protein
MKRERSGRKHEKCDPERTSIVFFDNVSMKPELPSFRTISDGYDRSEVDQFVRASVDECARLRERVAELDGILGAVLQYLQARRQPTSERDTLTSKRAGAESTVDTNTPATRVSDRLFLLIAGVVAALALISGAIVLEIWPLSQFQHSTSANTTVTGQHNIPRPVPAALPASPPTVTAPDTRATSPPVTPVQSTERSTPVDVDGLMLELEARTECWVGVTLDEDRRVERLLKQGEHLQVRARNAVVLRVGNAGALSLTINGLAARSLGPLGRPVTIHMTPATFRRLMDTPESTVASN